MQTYEKTVIDLRGIQAQLLDSLGTNLDGSENPSNFQMELPTLWYIESNVMAKQLMKSVNANLVINMVMLSSIVIYSLMLSDVNE